MNNKMSQILEGLQELKDYEAIFRLDAGSMGGSVKHAVVKAVSVDDAREQVKKKYPGATGIEVSLKD